MKLLRELRRRWILALSIGLLLGVSAGVAVWLLIPPRYTTYALVRVAPSELQLLPGNSPQGDAGQVYQKTQMALMKSRPIIQAALRRTRSMQFSLLGAEADPASWLERELQVGVLEGTDIVRIALTGQSSQEITDLVNSVKDAYVEQALTVERDQKLALLNEVEKIYVASEERILAQRQNLRRLAEALQISDSAVLTLKQKLALEEFAALKKELSLMQSNLSRIQMKVLAEKAKVQSPERIVVADSLLEDELDRDPMVVAFLGALQRRWTESSDRTTPLSLESRPDSLETALATAQKQLAELRAKRRPEVTERLKKRILDQAKSQVQQTEYEMALMENQKKALETEVNHLARYAERIGTTPIELELKRNEIEQAEAIMKSLRAEKARLNVEVQANKHRVTVLYDAEAPQIHAETRVQSAAAVGAAAFILALLGVSLVSRRAANSP